jgi:hypothetical protein
VAIEGNGGDATIATAAEALIGSVFGVVVSARPGIYGPSLAGKRLERLESTSNTPELLPACGG